MHIVYQVRGTACHGNDSLKTCARCQTMRSRAHAPYGHFDAPSRETLLNWRAIVCMPLIHFTRATTAANCACFLFILTRITAFYLRRNLNVLN